MGLYKYDGNKVATVKDVTYPEISNNRICFMAKGNQTGIIYFATDHDLKTYFVTNGKIQQIYNRNKKGVF
jgi:hypothetical protein